MTTSRRDFLKLGSGAAGAGWVGMQWPALLALGQAACDARDAGAAFANLDVVLAADLAAIAAQIVPSDDTGPGAEEAGVVYFMDQAFGSFMAGAREFIAGGIAELTAAAAGTRFAELPGERQRELLLAHEQTAWFGALRFLTIGGMFAMPAHGGNRDYAGWRLLGFDNRHAWAPPFGAYDEGEHGDG